MRYTKRVFSNFSIILFAAVVFSGTSTIWAQWEFNFSTSQEYNSNPLRLPDAKADFISSFNAGIENDLSNVKLLYFGSYTRFETETGRNYFWHQLGFYREDTNYIYGFYGEQRINKTEYNFFDYYNLTGYYKQILESSYFIPTIGISGTIKKYLQLSDYDNLFLTGGASINKGFNTKTTLILNAGINYKYYFNSSMSTYSDSGMYPVYRRGHSAYSSLSTTQFYANIRVAQSLFENTGLALYYLNRSLIDGNEAVGGYYYTYGDESDLYDDPVSRNENAIGLDYTQILPGDIILKTGFEYSSRMYPSQGIYLTADVYETGEERNDTQYYYYLNAATTFLLSSNDLYKLHANLGYGYFDKNSNSYWYDFSGSSFSLNLSLQF